MNEQTKIALSKREIEVLKELEFFLDKKEITEKTYVLFSELTEHLKNSATFNRVSFPVGTDVVRGKISKGENYLGLPFIILDFPRLFTTDQYFAFRTFLWWGNFISNTFLISGEQLPLVRENFLERFTILSKKGVWLCISDSPWNHHFKKDNFIPLNSLSKRDAMEIFKHQNFLKVARKLSIAKVNGLVDFSLESFTVLLSITE